MPYVVRFMTEALGYFIYGAIKIIILEINHISSFIPLLVTLIKIRRSLSLISLTYQQLIHPQ